MHVFSTKITDQDGQPSEDKMFSGATVAGELRFYVRLFYATETLM